MRLLVRRAHRRRQPFRMPGGEVDVRGRILRIGHLDTDGGRDVAAQHHVRTRVRLVRTPGAGLLRVQLRHLTQCRQRDARVARHQRVRHDPDPYAPVGADAYAGQRGTRHQGAQHRQQPEGQQHQRAAHTDTGGDQPPGAGRGQTFVVGLSRRNHGSKLGTRARGHRTAVRSAPVSAANSPGSPRSPGPRRHPRRRRPTRSRRCGIRRPRLRVSCSAPTTTCASAAATASRTASTSRHVPGKA